MPKRPSDEHGGGRAAAAKLSTLRRRQHLYLVLDDWELGYSIRKIDLLPDSGSDDLEQSQSTDDDDDCIMTEPQCLPPAVFRLEAPHARSGLFTAFGSKIMFMAVHNTPWGTIPMYDVHTRSLTAAPRRKSEPSRYRCAHVQVDGKLFLLDDSHFEMLQPPPPPVDGARFKVRFDWSWHDLPEPRYQSVVSHAVHPDGRRRTMVFSMLKRTLKRLKLATFSFNIDSSCWTRHGAWVLPFKGRGYFDRNLDVWVGLSCDEEALGYICACDVLSADTKNRQPPTCKLSKEKLFCVDPTEEHIGATLVHVGERSSFCLVQCLSTDDDCWGLLNFQFNVQLTVPQIIKEWKRHLRNKFALDLFIIACWGIWMNRNNAIFKGINPSISQFRNHLIEETSHLLLRIKPSLAPTLELWIATNL